MAKFLADWRNPALILTVIGTVLFGSLWISTRQTTVGTAIIVGDKTFTEKDIVNELKNRAGNQIVEKLVSAALIDNYAQQKGVTATPAEIDQLWNFNKNQVELAGQDFTAVLKKQGISAEAFRDDLRTQVLQVKLTVTPEEMRSTVAALAKSGKPPFVLPPRYHIRMMTFASVKDAQNAIAMIAKGDDGVSQAVATSVEGADAKRVHLYAPGLMKGNPVVDKAIKGLQPGQCSQPIAMPGKGREQWRAVIQLVDVEPQVIPTFENSNIVAGQVFLQSGGEQAARKVADLEGEALNDIDVQFLTDDYSDARQFFKDRKLRNPVIPGMVNTAPGTKTAAPTPTPATKK